MSAAWDTAGDPFHIDPSERVWAEIVQNLWPEDPVQQFAEVNTIKTEMQDRVTEFRREMAGIRAMVRQKVEVEPYLRTVADHGSAYRRAHDQQRHAAVLRSIMTTWARSKLRGPEQAEPSQHQAQGWRVPF